MAQLFLLQCQQLNCPGFRPHGSI